MNNRRFNVGDKVWIRWGNYAAHYDADEDYPCLAQYGVKAIKTYNLGGPTYALGVTGVSRLSPWYPEECLYASVSEALTKELAILQERHAHEIKRFFEMMADMNTVVQVGE